MSTKNVDMHESELKTFGSWLRGKGERTEKIISVVVLLTEIILLLWHNIPEHITYYVFTGLNCFFCFFIYFTYVNKSWNILNILDKDHSLKDSYQHPYFKTEEYKEVVRIITEAMKDMVIDVNDKKNTAISIKKKINSDIDSKIKEHAEAEEKVASTKNAEVTINYETIRKIVERLFTSDIDWVEKLIANVPKDTKILNAVEINKFIKIDYLKMESDGANTLIKQFTSIRWAWFFTGMLYVVFILNMYLFSEGTKNVSPYLVFLKPWLQGANVILSLLSTYYYLVAYYVMYYVTHEENSDNPYKDKHIHYKKTVWWLAVMLFVCVGYVFLYNYYKGGNPAYRQTVDFKDNSSHKIIIVGNHTNIQKNDAIVITDGEGQQITYSIIDSCSSNGDVDDLYIEIDQSHKKKVIIEDFYHKNIHVSGCDKKNIDGRLEINIDNPDSKEKRTLRMDVAKNIKNVKAAYRNEPTKGNVVDFVFQCIAGLLTALIMCFFVGRFESLTFYTPTWILVILYFYAVIQGFLVFLDADFLKDNGLLLLVHDKITKLIFFMALLGKVVLYIYLQGIYNTKRLFNYFIKLKYERKNSKEEWERDWQGIDVDYISHDK